MANVGLVIVGILIVAGVFILTNVIYTPQDAANWRTIESLCQSDIGSFVSGLDENTAQECEKYRLLGTISEYAIFLYILGGVLFLVGLAIPSGGGKETIIVHQPAQPQIVHSAPPVHVNVQAGERQHNFCPGCGSQITKGDNHCRSCGTKID